jgi:hypothetical protein
MPSRRAFLRGAVIAAATPAIAFAPALVASIGHLIGQHTTLDELFQAADEKATEIAKDPSKPAYPHILAREFGPYRSGMLPKENGFFTEAEIVALFDRERRYADLARDALSPRRCAEIVASADERQGRALEVFRLRTAVYDEWRRSSGYAAATAERQRLGTLIGRLENDIVSYRPDSLDDVRSKALFLGSVYGDEPPEDIVQAFVKSLIA